MVQRFKGCILITIRNFVNVLYGKTDRFQIPTNLPAIADLLGYARSVHETGEAGGFGTWHLAIMWQNQHRYEDFGSSVLSIPNPER